MNDKTHGQRVKRDIINAGLALWRADPASVSARRIAREERMSHCNVFYHFGTTAQLKRAIADEAVRTGDPIIIPMLIASRHDAVADMSADDRARFMRGV